MLIEDVEKTNLKFSVPVFYQESGGIRYINKAHIDMIPCNKSRSTAGTGNGHMTRFLVVYFEKPLHPVPQTRDDAGYIFPYHMTRNALFTGIIERDTLSNVPLRTKVLEIVNDNFPEYVLEWDQSGTQSSRGMTFTKVSFTDIVRNYRDRVTKLNAVTTLLEDLYDNPTPDTAQSMIEAIDVLNEDWPELDTIRRSLEPIAELRNLT